MEELKKKIESQLEDLERALRRLEESLKVKKTDIVRDSVIQRFEFTFELAWKSLKTSNEMLGRPSASPKECFRLSAQTKLIDNPEIWFDYLKARNLAAHVYDEKEADEVYSLAKRFPIDVKNILQKIKDTAL